MKQFRGMAAIAPAVLLGASGLSQPVNHGGVIFAAMLPAFALPAPGSSPPSPAAAGGNRTAATPAQPQGAQASGQAAFDRVCKGCHGPEARGDAAPRLVPFSREYEEVLGIVREGTGQMPPISVRELSDDGVAQIVAYLKSLSR